MRHREMEIGVIQSLANDGDCFKGVRELGLTVCQLAGWDASMATPDIARSAVRRARNSEVRICAVWAGWPGPKIWDFVDGPKTLGLVPRQYREERLAALRRWTDFAHWIEAPAIITHCGFIPENISDEEFNPVVEAVGEAARYCNQKGLEFWFETGQETPVVLLRTIEKLGCDNIGINLDPANLIMYGKGNPVDALDVFGRYVRNVHVKDGRYPVDGNRLGKEVRVGEGKVNFPLLLQRLRDTGFSGELIIEREISGPEQEADIRQTVVDLQQWIAELNRNGNDRKELLR